MKQFVESLFAVLGLMGAEAWFLHGYFGAGPEFEPFLLTLGAMGLVLAKDPLKEKFGAAKAARAHDGELFARFQRELPFDPTIRLLKEQDLGDVVRKDHVEPLYAFANLWDNVEREFLDRKLEKHRKVLLQDARALVNEIVLRTVPVQTGEFISVFSDNQRASGNPRPAHVLEDARVLNEKAPVFATKYEAFVRTCRAKLG
jgi:hypothetical protein